MKIAATLARVLLGLAFVVFGLNGFLHFLPMKSEGMSAAGMQFGQAMAESHYFAAVFACQFIGGLILLTNRFVPIGLTILGPVIVNILCFHIFMNPAGIVPGLIVTALWLFVFYSVRYAFAGVFQAQTPVETTTA